MAMRTIDKSKDKNDREQALSIFGLVRHFNEREKMLYREMLKKASRPTGKNVMEFYKNSKEQTQ